MARRRLIRSQEVARTRARIERERNPIIEMMLIVSVIGGAGFIASSTLFHAGLLEMWRRYLAAFAIAYLVFLFLLWIRVRLSAAAYERLDETAPDRDAAIRIYFGSTWSSRQWTSVRNDGIDVTDVFDGADAGEGRLLPIARIGLVAGLLVSAFFVVQGAPVLFAELIVDGVLSASLYRRMRGLEESHGLRPVLRHTFLPFPLTALLLPATGWEMARHASGTHTLGEVLRYNGIGAR